MLPKTSRVNTSVTRLLLFLAILGLFLGAFSLHLRLDAMGVEHDSMQVYMCIPSGKFLKPFTLGFNHLAADYFWIKTISYFGDHLISDRTYPWLYHLLDLVTTLDPDFIWPYYFGGIVLSLEAKQVEQSNLILKKAMAHHPDVWKFPFYIGFNYWFYYDNPQKAASYIERAAGLPGAPNYLKTFPARLYSEAGANDAAVRFLLEMLKTTQEPRLRAKIEKRIQDILHGAMEPPKKPLSEVTRGTP
jgi:hypothetical protein